MTIAPRVIFNFVWRGCNFAKNHPHFELAIPGGSPGVGRPGVCRPATSCVGHSNAQCRQPAGSRWRAFEFRLIRCFLVLDRQRSIVDSHFSIMLPGNWIGRPFGSLLEHTSAFGKFCCLRHRTPQDKRVRIFPLKQQRFRLLALAIGVECMS
jgi:hypothetical protein